MQYVDKPLALPGSCFLCGCATRNGYVDTEVSLDFHGAVYICIDECLRQMAQDNGFWTPDQVNKTADELLVTRTEREILIRENQALRTANRELASANSFADDFPRNVDRINDVPLPFTDSFGSGPKTVHSDVESGASKLPVAVDSGSWNTLKSVAAGTSNVDEGEGNSPESSDDTPMDGIRSDSSESGSELTI